MGTTRTVSPAAGQRKLWWITNKMLEKYVKEARILMATHQKGDVSAALPLLEAALVIAPRMDVILEMKAKCLLTLRRFKEVADMLHDTIPSFKIATSDESSSLASSSTTENSSRLLIRDRLNLTSSGGIEGEHEFKCLSVTDLKKKVMAGLGKNAEKERQWRYLVLGQACCHLGLLEDAIVLLQTGERLAAAAFRQESVSLSDDFFSSNKFPLSSENLINSPLQTQKKMEWESTAHLLCHIKLLVHRKTAAIAALDAGIYSEAIRHFSKILDGRRGAPQAFLAQCYVHRASAYQSAGRIADAISDCNKALALDMSSVQALTVRASLFETIRCLPDSLHDLEHLKLLYNSILRDKKLPSPVWKSHAVQYREIPGKLCSLASKIQQLKQRVADGETGNADFYALMGLKRNCSRSELERSHLLLSLKHKPDRSSAFIERCEFSDANEADSVRDRARFSAHFLYRLIQKGYANVLVAIVEQDPTQKQRKRSAACRGAVPSEAGGDVADLIDNKTTTPAPSVFQGVFCRDLAAVGSLLSQAGFNRSIPLKYEALSW